MLSLYQQNDTSFISSYTLSKFKAVNHLSSWDDFLFLGAFSFNCFPTFIITVNDKTEINTIDKAYGSLRLKTVNLRHE